MISNIDSNYKSICKYFAFSNSRILSFKECKKEVKNKKFKSHNDYLANRKKNWPANPDRDYLNKGWKDWLDFLGKENNKEWLEFEKIKKKIKGKFKNQTEYRKNREKYWPSNPHKTYKKKGWRGWKDFLGKTPEFNELKKLVKGKFKNIADYQKNRQKNWPSCPYRVYKNKGWIDWYDFLGKEDWPEFNELKRQIKGKFKREKDYQKNRKQNWPSAPHEVYKNKGWKDWYDFLGK